MDLRNCCAVVESNQGVLDGRGGFFGLVSRHCSYSLEGKGVRHVYWSSNKGLPSRVLFKSLLIQLRRSAFTSVMKEGKLSPPLDKGGNKTCRLILSLLFVHGQAKIYFGLVVLLFLVQKTWRQHKLAETNLEILQAQFFQRVSGPATAIYWALFPFSLFWCNNYCCCWQLHHGKDKFQKFFRDLLDTGILKVLSCFWSKYQCQGFCFLFITSWQFLVT